MPYEIIDDEPLAEAGGYEILDDEEPTSPASDPNLVLKLLTPTGGHDFSRLGELPVDVRQRLVGVDPQGKMFLKPESLTPQERAVMQSGVSQGMANLDRQEAAIREKRGQEIADYGRNVGQLPGAAVAATGVGIPVAAGLSAAGGQIGESIARAVGEGMGYQAPNDSPLDTAKEMATDFGVNYIGGKLPTWGGAIAEKTGIKKYVLDPAMEALASNRVVQWAGGMIRTAPETPVETVKGLASVGDDGVQRAAKIAWERSGRRGVQNPVAIGKKGMDTKTAESTLQVIDEASGSNPFTSALDLPGSGKPQQAFMMGEAEYADDIARMGGVMSEDGVYNVATGQIEGTGWKYGGTVKKVIGNIKNSILPSMAEARRQLVSYADNGITNMDLVLQQNGISKESVGPVIELLQKRIGDRSLWKPTQGQAESLQEMLSGINSLFERNLTATDTLAMLENVNSFLRQANEFSKGHLVDASLGNRFSQEVLGVARDLRSSLAKALDDFVGAADVNGNPMIQRLTKDMHALDEFADGLAAADLHYAQRLGGAVGKEGGEEGFGLSLGFRSGVHLKLPGAGAQTEQAAKEAASKAGRDAFDRLNDFIQIRRGGLKLGPSQAPVPVPLPPMVEMATMAAAQGGAAFSRDSAENLRNPAFLEQALQAIPDPAMQQAIQQAVVNGSDEERRSAIATLATQAPDQFAEPEVPVKSYVDGIIHDPLDKQFAETKARELYKDGTLSQSELVATLESIRTQKALPSEFVKAWRSDDSRDTVTDHLRDVEGFRLMGYKDAGKGGMNFGTGFSAGQWTARQLYQMGVPGDIVAKLKPVLGRSWDQIPEGRRPKLTPGQAETLDRIVLRTLQSEVDKKLIDATGTSLFDLPEEKQAVITSMTYVFGGPFRTDAAQDVWKGIVKSVKTGDDLHLTKAIEKSERLNTTRKAKETAQLARLQAKQEKRPLAPSVQEPSYEQSTLSQVARNVTFPDGTKRTVYKDEMA